MSLEREFEGAAGAILRWISFDSFEVVKLPGLHDGQLWRVFSFKIIPFDGTLYEFNGFQPVSISVSFCDLGVELYIQDLGPVSRKTR